MTPFSSLSNRIFFATALLAVLLISTAIFIVNRSVTAQAEGELRRGLAEAVTLVEEYRTILFDSFKRDARFIADLPVLKAAVDTGDAKTVEPIAREYQEQLANADLFAVTDRQGHLLARLGTSDVPDEVLSAAAHASASRQPATAFWPERHGILLVTSTPIVVTGGGTADELGTLSIGASLGERQALRFKTLTNSEIAFGVGNAIYAATLPRDTWPELAPLLSSTGDHTVTLHGDEYLAVTAPLAPAGANGQPMTIVLRSRSERLRFLRALHTQLALIAVFAVLAATLLSYAIARTVTRPLGAITATMREMAATGDLTRRIPVTSARWRDEDAHLLATTFNSMTDSIQRFQREAAQRERLSSLGRLSTVVAHEIRNPLMIIKAALRALRRDEVRPDQVQAAARDIDEEIARLNRIVSEVLDFARPIKFELASADLNAVAADAARAAAPAANGTLVRLDLDGRVPEVTTDAERLRQVLVNVIGNAVQSVEGRAANGEAPVRVTTALVDGSRVAITVQDRGAGIAPEDLPKIFDPYFTTRRTGTGIGLAISRNIVEGLGGRISVSSRLEGGTEVRIELPVHSRGV